MMAHLYLTVVTSDALEAGDGIASGATCESPTDVGKASIIALTMLVLELHLNCLPYRHLSDPIKITDAPLLNLDRYDFWFTVIVVLLNALLDQGIVFHPAFDQEHYLFATLDFTFPFVDAFDARLLNAGSQSSAYQGLSNFLGSINAIGGSDNHRVCLAHGGAFRLI